MGGACLPTIHSVALRPHPEPMPIAESTDVRIACWKCLRAIISFSRVALSVRERLYLWNCTCQSGSAHQQGHVKVAVVRTV
jgi:hypothetical protein